jgi:N-acyl homoserine lactone hydrolase
MSFDVFGDGSVQFVDLAGHSDGTTGVLVQNGGRFVLMTADACYNRRNWEQLKLQGITTDREKAMRALSWVREMSRKPDCAEILATHDADIRPHVITL